MRFFNSEKRKFETRMPSPSPWRQKLLTVAIFVILMMAGVLAAYKMSTGQVDLISGVEKVCVEGVVYLRSANDYSSPLTVAVDRNNKPLSCGDRR
jgi:hypothetical protein